MKLSSNRVVCHPGSRGHRARLLGALLTLLIPEVARSDNSLLWTTNYYSVTGLTLVQIRGSINRSRPQKAKPATDALTHWRVEWRYTVMPTANGCRCSSFGTTTAITITMPRWTAPVGATPSTRNAWDRYIQALGQHEAGHAQLALAAAADLNKLAKGLGEQTDCVGLKEKINALGQAVLEDYRKREKAYDERTQHGLTQGARLP